MCLNKGLQLYSRSYVLKHSQLILVPVAVSRQRAAHVCLQDGRVVFMLPFQGHIIAGTTDSACDVVDRPRAKADEVKFILDAITDFLSIKVS